MQFVAKHLLASHSAVAAQTFLAQTFWHLNGHSNWSDISQLGCLFLLLASLWWHDFHVFVRDRWGWESFSMGFYLRNAWTCLLTLYWLSSFRAYSKTSAECLCNGFLEKSQNAQHLDLLNFTEKLKISLDSYEISLGCRRPPLFAYMQCSSSARI